MKKKIFPDMCTYCHQSGQPAVLALAEGVVRSRKKSALVKPTDEVCSRVVIKIGDGFGPTDVYNESRREPCLLGDGQNLQRVPGSSAILRCGRQILP